VSPIAPVGGWIEAAPIGDLLVRAAARAPDRPALIFPDERLSWAGLERRASAIGRGLVALGVAPGARVGILQPNGPDCVASIFGALLAGAVAVPMNIRYRVAELPHLIEDAGLAAVLVSDRIDGHVDLAALLRESVARAAGPAPAMVLLGERREEGFVGEAELAERAGRLAAGALEERRRAVRVREPAILLYTSGTTSRPSGCPLTHEALVRNWAAVAAVLALGAEDRLWAPCPLFHLAAIGPLIACAATAAAFVSDTWFEPGRALELIERERATVLYPAYPPISQGIFGDPAYATADLAAARVIVNVAPPDTLRKMQAAIPQATQLSLYGLTEGGGAVTYGRLDDTEDARMETCGLPLPGIEVRVTDAGEILVRGYGLCEGYHGDPEKTAATFDAEGWLHTGDRGELDPAGRLRFLGRLKEMLKVGGENVAPAEVEARLEAHPAVKLAQVVGVPDRRLDEVPVAFVELLPGTEASEDELIEHCRAGIAGFKVPRHLRFVEEWPLSATKIQKGPLRERMIDELHSHV
jgi:acyl-CoA synthetase (AMP-forming)/AMP-acid ligase II